MRFKKFLLTTCFMSGILFSLSLQNVFAAQQESWSEWLRTLRQEAIDQGIRPELFDEVFQNIKAPNRTVLSYDKHQPEKRLTFLKYRNTRADQYRIAIGRKKLQQYRPLLNEIGQKYGVNPCFIVSLWGLETSYGTFMGKFPVVQSLATLAHDPRRATFFRKQLLYALQILNEGHIKNADFKGEWAGASGHPQFLPSSWHNYAVDYDQDGKKDIWSSYPDVFASIANYLSKNGWQKDQPWAIIVNVPESLTHLENQKISKTLAEWEALHVTTLKGQSWPEDKNLLAQLIRPDGGPNMLIFDNFNVIMKWNRSNYYAGTVGYLAEEICRSPL
ncbi:MAG: lytic transglycosylase [Coxiella sp. RIFCSPHIGHO2_12_FULL_42_15]|nr:MAG: lytic transglycosylase [Coxiella sp. RIFCSPHIGHO2_12_FULL_42_15]